MSDAAPPPVEGPPPRLMITHMVNNNFKSYFGTQIVGPFHKVRMCTQHVYTLQDLFNFLIKNTQKIQLPRHLSRPSRSTFLRILLVHAFLLLQIHTSNARCTIARTHQQAYTPTTMVHFLKNKELWIEAFSSPNLQSSPPSLFNRAPTLLAVPYRTNMEHVEKEGRACAGGAAVSSY